MTRILINSSGITVPSLAVAAGKDPATFFVQSWTRDTIVFGIVPETFEALRKCSSMQAKTRVLVNLSSSSHSVDDFCNSNGGRCFHSFIFDDLLIL